MPPDTTDQRAKIRAIAEGAVPLDQLPLAIADFADALAGTENSAPAESGTSTGTPTNGSTAS